MDYCYACEEKIGADYFCVYDGLRLFLIEAKGTPGDIFEEYKHDRLYYCKECLNELRVINGYIFKVNDAEEEHPTQWGD